MKRLSFIITSFLYYISYFYFVFNFNRSSFFELLMIGHVYALLGLFSDSLITLKDMGAWGVRYFYSCLLIYFFEMTLNLNNFDFIWWNLFENSFLIKRTFLLLVVYLLGRMTHRYVLSNYLNLSYLDAKISNRFVFLSLFIYSPLFITYIRNSSYFMELSPAKTGLFVLVLLCFLLPISESIFSLLKLFVHRNFNLSFITGVSFHLALLFNYLIQFSVRGPERIVDYYVFPNVNLFQICLFTLLFLVSYLIINRFILTTLLIIIFSLCFTVANYVKILMRSEPILPSDLVWIKEIKFLLSMLDSKVYILVLLVSGVIIAIYYTLFRKGKEGKINLSFFQRCLYLVSILSVVFASIAFLIPYNRDLHHLRLPILSEIVELPETNWLGKKDNARLRTLSYIWLLEITSPIAEKPIDYSFATMQAVVEKYKEKAREINKEREEILSEQTVIIVLSESLSDPLRIDGVELSYDPMKNIKSVMENTTSGIMTSRYYGGGTAAIEYEIMTGLLPKYYLSNMVNVVSKLQYIPSLSWQFNQENRYILHPSNAMNYNRLSVYSNLQFENLVFDKNGNQPFLDVNILGSYMSDYSLYDNVLEKIDDSKSQFFSVVSMQNHSPWYATQPDDLIAFHENLSEDNLKTFTSYVRLLDATDKSTKEFLERLKQIDKKITVVFYGDHLPGFYPEELFYNQPSSKYETDYFIWSNWRKNELSYNRIYPRDFTALLKEHTNSKVSPYEALLTMTIGLEEVEEDRLTATQSEILNDLKLVEYDISIGKNYLKDTGFWN